MKRTGKIARLPYHTRQELNHRLLDNEPGDALVAWLNARPEVLTVLSEQFQGNPITKQNLSEWRTGGFAVWELRQEVFGDVQEAEDFSDELDAVTKSSLVDKLCTVLAGRYASLLVRWDGEVTPAFTQKLRALHGLCRDLTTLRRAALAARKARMATEPDEVESDPVAPGRTELRREALGAGREAGKEGGRMMNEEMKKTPGTSGQSKPVVPGRTTLTSDIVVSALAELATLGRHAAPLSKPVPGMPGSILSEALKAARAKTTSGQPPLAVLPDWDEVVQPVISLCRK